MDLNSGTWTRDWRKFDKKAFSEIIRIIYLISTDGVPEDFPDLEDSDNKLSIAFNMSNGLVILDIFEAEDSIIEFIINPKTNKLEKILQCSGCGNIFIQSDAKHKPEDKFCAQWMVDEGLVNERDFPEFLNEDEEIHEEPPLYEDI